MSKVPYIKLKEICYVNQGLQIPISERFSEDGPNRFFYITVQFLKVGHLEKFYIENPPKSTICNENDIIIVRTGSTGQILTGIKGCFHNNFFKVNYDEEKVIGKYLYYCLKTEQKQNEMKKKAGITTIPDLNHFMFLDIKIPLPSIEHQKFTVKILDSISNKIELNNKINAELEAMAKLIFNYWFVQFDFPNEERKPYKNSGGKMVWNEELKRDIPEGWEVKELSKVLSIKYGKDHKKLNNGIIPVYGSGGVMRYVDEYLYNDETILIPRKGSIGNLFYVNEPFWSVDTMFYTKASKKGSVLYYFYQLSKLNLQTLNVGTAVPSLTVEILNKIKLLAPEPIILEKFNSIIFRNKEKSLSIIKENQKLSELRDWLLPMLMNGQVKVK